MIAALIDIVLAPFVAVSGFFLKQVRRYGLGKLPFSRAVLLQVGVLPVRDHYYEPQLYFPDSLDLASDRELPGIDWNVEGQLRFLDRLVYGAELMDVPYNASNELEYGFNNNQFGVGDAEYWYQVVRALKPKRIFEVGSGNSTKMAIRAIRRNQKDDPGYACKHVCIEPYEMPWLERSGVQVLRKRIEDMDFAFFSELEANDILFVDSSHIIRPHGDVLFEYLELLPRINPGVYVHVHDIFSPRNYPREWLARDLRLWNEQYLLEAFLTHNTDWEIVGALNHLGVHHPERLGEICPNMGRHVQPGSFYLRRVK